MPPLCFGSAPSHEGPLRNQGTKDTKTDPGRKPRRPSRTRRARRRAGRLFRLTETTKASHDTKTTKTDTPSRRRSGHRSRRHSARCLRRCDALACVRRAACVAGLRAPPGHERETMSSAVSLASRSGDPRAASQSRRTLRALVPFVLFVKRRRRRRGSSQRRSKHESPRLQ
jgi:hypothetical protein